MSDLTLQSTEVGNQAPSPRVDEALDRNPERARQDHRLRERHRTHFSAATIVFAVPAVALWMSFGTLHYHHTADSLLPVLISLQKWTPFYWDQDRWGMLIPLLALPFHDPLHNLIFQGWLMATAALLAPFLVAKYLYTEGWLEVGAITNLLLLLAPVDVRFDWILGQPYALSISLGTGSLIALAVSNRWVRYPLAGLLMFAANWVNSGVCLLLWPLILLRRRNLKLSFPLSLAGVVFGRLLSRLGPHYTPTTLVSAPAWIHATYALGEGVLQAIGPYRIVALLILVGLLAGFSRKASIAPFAVGIICWLFVADFYWVQFNLYLPRYVFPSLLMFGIGCAYVILWGIRTVPREVPIACFIAAYMIGYGIPSSHALQKQLSAHAVPANVCVIHGDYWRVWPAVFSANLSNYDRTGKNDIYGVTTRSGPTDSLHRRSADCIDLDLDRAPN